MVKRRMKKIMHPLQIQPSPEKKGDPWKLVKSTSKKIAEVGKEKEIWLSRKV